MYAKVLIMGLVLTAAVAGAAMYYFQVYAFYDEVEGGSVELVSMFTGDSEEIPFAEFQAIDSDSSPLRYRACFTTELSLGLLTDTYEIADGAEPRVAPGWFDCFDAQAIGEAVKSGEALAFIGRQNVEYGIDRIVAVYPDGRGYVWHDINICGERVFDGEAAPEGCPDPDTFEAN